MPLPAAFAWTRFGTEAGQSIEDISGNPHEFRCNMQRQLILELEVTKPEHISNRAFFRFLNMTSQIDA